MSPHGREIMAKICQVGQRWRGCASNGRRAASLLLWHSGTKHNLPPPCLLLVADTSALPQQRLVAVLRAGEHRKLERDTGGNPEQLNRGFQISGDDVK